MKQNERGAQDPKMGEEVRDRARGRAGMTKKEGESARGDGRAVQRMGDAVGIISKHPLYPAAGTERPVCVWMFVCVLLGGFCTCCSGGLQFYEHIYSFKAKFPSLQVRTPHEFACRCIDRGLQKRKKKNQFENQVSQ